MRKLISSLTKILNIRLFLPLYICLGIMFTLLIRQGHMQLLDPAGVVASSQSKILWGALIFAAIVGSAIIVSFFVVIFRYQERNHRRYEPTWTAGKRFQLATWSALTVIILIISLGVWETTHLIDPYRPLASSKTPITIQVIALQWKWLFIYPNDHIASVNSLAVPVGTPVNFQLTADAPMNSFWVPSLSGQIYAMPGMVTQLHIQADKPGDYPGSAAEINGDGYAGMAFTVRAVSANDYRTWVSSVKRTNQSLDYRTYVQLARPSSYNQPTVYTVPDSNLFHEVVMQFMAPGANLSELQIGGNRL